MSSDQQWSEADGKSKLQMIGGSQTPMLHDAAATIAERDATIAGLQQTSISLRDAMGNRDATIAELQRVAESNYDKWQEWRKRAGDEENAAIQLRQVLDSERETIAELRAEVEAANIAFTLADRNWHAQREQIATLQARVRELERLLNCAPDFLQKALGYTPTTEK